MDSGSVVGLETGLASRSWGFRKAPTENGDIGSIYEAKRQNMTFIWGGTNATIVVSDLHGIHLSFPLFLDSANITQKAAIRFFRGSWNEEVTRAVIPTVLVSSLG